MNKHWIFISQFTQNQIININFSGNNCLVCDVKQNKVFSLGIGTRCLYKLVDSSTVNLHTLTVEDNTSILWYKRNGHLNLLPSLCAYSTFLFNKSKTCAKSLAGRQKGQLFPTDNSQQAKNVFGLIHLNLLLNSSMDTKTRNRYWSNSRLLTPHDKMQEEAS